MTSLKQGNKGGTLTCSGREYICANGIRGEIEITRGHEFLHKISFLFNYIFSDESVLFYFTT